MGKILQTEVTFPLIQYIQTGFAGVCCWEGWSFALQRDLSGPRCLSIGAGAIRPSESGSIPSRQCDKIKAFRRPEWSLPCSPALKLVHCSGNTAVAA